MWRFQEEVGLSENQGTSSNPTTEEAATMGQNSWIEFVSPGEEKRMPQITIRKLYTDFEENINPTKYFFTGMYSFMELFSTCFVYF